MSYGTINAVSTSAEATSYNNASTSSIITSDNVQGAIDQLFQSVSEGKSLIAGALTDKGISTSASDSWQTIANNIGGMSSRVATGVVKTDNQSDTFTVKNLPFSPVYAFCFLEAEDNSTFYNLQAGLNIMSCNNITNMILFTSKVFDTVYLSGTDRLAFSSTNNSFTFRVTVAGTCYFMQTLTNLYYRWIAWN